MKSQIQKSKNLLKLASAGLCLTAAGLANNAKAQSQYFTTVTTGNTYSWDAANWNASPASANTGPYTSTWAPGDFARFANGASSTYTVTVNAAESIAGMINSGGSANTLIINDAGSGTGSLSVVPNATLQDGFGFTQGFLTSGGTTTINAPIIGTGGVEEEAGGGHLQLYGNNSYSGGTLFTSSSTFVDYNNNNSFGSGNIGFFNTTFSIMESSGTTPISLANPVQILGGTTGVNFIGTAPVTSAGTWTMGAFAVNIRNNGSSTAPVTLSGVMSGSGPVNFSGANGGKITLGAVNNYTGATSVGVSGDTAITLQMGVANAIATSSSLVLAGGTFNPGGFNQAMSGTLGLTASSTIDYGAGAAALGFANSSGVAWTAGKILNLANWNPSIDSLQVGTSSSGLTSGQLADIEFNGAGLGSAQINANGFVSEVPEPSTIALGVIGGLTLLRNIRRRM